MNAGAVMAGLLLVCGLATAPAVVRADDTVEDPTFDRDAALAESRAAVGRTVGDYLFTDTEGQPVRLSTYRGQPLVVSFVYTSCSGFCPTITETLKRALKAAERELEASSFAVVTIGFDARADTPDRMRAFAHSHGANRENWKFLSGDRTAVTGLARDLGFDFRPAVQGFDHIAQTSVIGPDGRIYRQIYGENFDPPVLIEPIKDLVFGRNSNDLLSLEGLVKQIRLFCTVYDPAAGRYRFDYSIFIGGAIGLISLGGVAFVLARSLLQEWRGRLKS
ncbi:MAG: SCO family protein [Pseudomonadota bacterium]